MRVDIVERDYASGRVLTIVNAATRRYIATLGPFDNAFTSERIMEAVNLYDDLHRLGLLKPVLVAVEKRSAEQANLPHP
jgi:hypothetical protein